MKKILNPKIDMPSLAEERVSLLLERAVRNRVSDVDEALKIAETHNVTIPEKYRFRICDGCRSLLHPGTNAKVRVSSGLIKYNCCQCGSVNRHGY